MYLVKSLPPGHHLLFPGGWLHPDPKRNHLVLYSLLRSPSGGTYDFSVLNTGCPGGGGLEYHPAKFNEFTGKAERNLCLRVGSVEAGRITDSR